MVESLSSHKVVKAPADADESDIVACIAAVTAYIKAEEEELAAAVNSHKKEQLSPWGQVALLEGVQHSAASQAAVDVSRSNSKNKNLSLWRNFPAIFWGALSLTGLLTGFGAQAVYADPIDLNPEQSFNDDVTYTAQVPSRAGWRPVSPPVVPNSFKSSPVIKVALAVGVGDIAVDAIDGAQVLDMSSGRQIAQLQPLSQWRVGSRTINGAPAIAFTGRRDVDQYLVATGDQLKPATERNVAFFPSQFLGPPALKAFQAAQQNGTVVKKPATASIVVSCGPQAPVVVSPGTQAQNLLAPGAVSSTVANSASAAGTLPFAPPRTATAPRSGPALDEVEVDDIDIDEDDERVSGSPPTQTDGATSSGTSQFGGITNGVIITPNVTGASGSQSVFNLNGRLYRGSLWVKPETVKDKNGASVTRLTAINVIDLEDYLMSVLPSEMPSSWPREALKAQAIAARSYAIANLGKYRSKGYDVQATVMDQAYRGASAETIASNRAVSETNGIVMKHAGKVVPGFFHSSSAGHTDVAEHVWTKEVPYLKSVPDVDHKSKYVLWERKFPMTQIDGSLGKDVGTVLGLFPVHRSPAGRVKNLLVIGTKGSTFVSGTAVRQMFALPSTNFNVLAYQDSYLFKGQGFGHGLGMSQYGARGLADHGYNAAQILTYYYKDVTFEQIVETPAL
ncbi:SpoIID/LytB domain-containing protein [Candidatus Obscuribacterales bacterium]|nr:SpoIID/LytB domain-containing protein [Candidatus Obscuribacterales bacterium]